MIAPLDTSLFAFLFPCAHMCIYNKIPISYEGKDLYIIPFHSFVPKIRTYTRIQMNNRITFEELTEINNGHLTEKTDRLVLFLNWFLIDKNLESLDDKKVKPEAFQLNKIHLHSRRIVID